MHRVVCNRERKREISLARKFNVQRKEKKPWLNKEGVYDRKKELDSRGEGLKKGDHIFQEFWRVV